MPWTRASSSPSRLKLRAHDDPDPDAFGNPPDAAWVNDDEDALAEDTTEAGGVALVDGDLERYRDHEAEE